MDIQGVVTEYLYLYRLRYTGWCNKNIDIYIDLDIQGVVTEIFIFIDLEIQCVVTEILVII